MSPARTRGGALLDVNVLIALAWPNHTHHRPALDWFNRHHLDGWATTPITEAGFVRVSSNRAAIAAATTPELALQLLGQMTALPGHAFWLDDVAMVIGTGTDAGLITSHRTVTDAHLLALSHRHSGRLVTFDAGIAELLGEHSPELLDIQRPDRGS